MKKLKINGTNEFIYYEKLSTGLEVYMYPSNEVKSFYLTYNIKFGSMDTHVKLGSQKKTITFPHGTAHFLEHQLFQNEKDKSAFQDFANLGSSVNAYTSYDLTCYEVIGSTRFKENLEALVRFVNTPYFKEKSIINERDVIANEISMYENIPESISAFGLERILNVYDNHKYTISGTKEDLSEIYDKTLYRAYDIFYNHSNSFMILSGSFKVLEAIGLLKEFIKKYPGIPIKSFNRVKKREPLRVSKKYESYKMKVDKPYVNFAFKINKKPLKKFNNFILSTYLNVILDLKFSNTSDFYEKAINEHIINSDFSYSSEVRDDYIKIGFKYKTECIDESINLIKETLRERNINESDLERIKKVYIASYIRSFNDVITVQETILSDILMNSKINLDIISDYESLSLRKLNEIYNALDFSYEAIYTIETE